MKGPPIDQVVYDCMFPKPKTTDPQNFQGLLQRQLVPEVRLETQAFYGHLASQEAKYPGLDYSYQPHRVRLSRYPWHRRLFRAFDNLGLTNSEIAGLTKWEGTRWAKERFEREQGIVIRDTTADDIADWVEPQHRAPVAHQSAQRADVEDMDDMLERMENEDNENDMDEDGDDSDAEMQSVGAELNERLRAAVASREAGNSAVMDEEWEQWLKDAVEAGGLPFFSSNLGLTPARAPGARPTAADLPTMHPRLMNAARLGLWHQIPEVLHSLVRQELEANARQEAARTAAPQEAPSSSPSPPPPSSRQVNPTQSRTPHTAFVRRHEFSEYGSRYVRRSVPSSLSVPTPNAAAATSGTRVTLHLGGSRRPPQPPPPQPPQDNNNNPNP